MSANLEPCMLESLRAVSDAASAAAAAESDDVVTRERSTVNSYLRSSSSTSPNTAQLTSRQTELLSSLLRNVHLLAVSVFGLGNRLADVATV
jgi:hypothetical protein